MVPLFVSLFEQTWFAYDNIIKVGPFAPDMALGAVSKHLPFSYGFGVGSSKLDEKTPDLAFSCAPLPDPALSSAAGGTLSLIARLICSCRAP